MRRLNSHGVSLIETLVALAIAALMAGFGAPAFHDYLVNARLREAGNSLYAEAMLAQSEAIKRNGLVRLSIRGSTMQLADRTAEGANALMRERVLPNAVIADAASTLDFGSAGRPAVFGDEYRVDLSLAGVACSAEYRCPSLRVDAGGAVRLCGNRLDCR